MTQDDSYLKVVVRFEALLTAIQYQAATSKSGLARAADIPTATGHRYLNALERGQVLSRDTHGDYLRGANWWSIAFSAWGFGDVEPFSMPILRYVRAQTHRTAFWGLMQNGQLLIGPFLAGRSGTFRRPDGNGVYRYATSGVEGKQGLLRATSSSGKVQFCVVRNVATRDQASLIVGFYVGDMSDERYTVAKGILAQTAQRVRTSLAAHAAQSTRSLP